MISASADSGSDVAAPDAESADRGESIDLGGAEDAGIGVDAAEADAGAPDSAERDATAPDAQEAQDAGSSGPSPGQPAFGAALRFGVTVSPYNDPADIYHPDPATGTLPGPFPALVVLQGGNVAREHYSELASAVSRYGFIVIVQDHQRFFGISSGLFSEVSVLDAALATLAAEHARSGSPIAGQVDTSRAALFGHSLGGAVGFEAIGNECSSAFCRESSNTYARPGVLRAGVFYGANRKPPIGNNIPFTANGGLPILMIQGSRDGAATVAAGQTTYDRVIDPAKVFATVQGANHYGVTNINNPPGANAEATAPTLAQAVGLEIVGRWTGVFLNAHLREDPRALAYVYQSSSTPEASLSLQRQAPLSGPERLGPCAYGYASATLSRPGGGSLPVLALLPETNRGPAPVVIFNPGLQLSARSYMGRLQHLASWCYAVVANGITYSPLNVNDSAWTNDIQAMLAFTQNPGDPRFNGRFSSQRALLGHSAGAKNSFRLWGSAAPQSFASIIAWDVAGRTPPSASELGTGSSPVLHIGELFSSQNAVAGQYCAPADQNYEVYFGALPAALPTLAISMSDADHMSFLDRRGCGLACSACTVNQPGDFAAVGQRIRKYTLAWLERYVRGDQAYDTYLYGAAMSQDVAGGNVRAASK